MFPSLSCTSVTTMDRLPHSLLLHILSRLDDSADVASCRVASKAFDTVFPDLRSINLLYSSMSYNNSRSRVSTFPQQTKPFKKIFLDLISKLTTVESVFISLGSPIFSRIDPVNSDFHLLDEDFVNEWLPRVSESLKSLKIKGHPCYSQLKSNVLPLISKNCQNLVNLKLTFGWLSVDNLNPMPLLKKLKLRHIRLEDEQLNEFNKCFPNLQVLELMHVIGLKDPKINLLNLQTCHWHAYGGRLLSLTLITPNLITLKIISFWAGAIHVEAPMLSHFHLSFAHFNYSTTLNVKKFENLRTLWLDFSYTGSTLSSFLITKTVEDLTLYSGNKAPRDAIDSKLTLGKVFTVFPDVSSLRINAGAWSEFEACLNPEGWEILDGRKGLKTIHAYMKLVDPSLTFSSIACVLDQCVALSEVSLLINADVEKNISETFMSKCMARWPRLKWRWGVWGADTEDSWITDGISS